jgi:CheY-like chemotaxis protein
MATILVIDDEPVDRLLVAELLRAEGHEVLEAENGFEGLAVYDKTEVNLLITDMMMPEKDGFETITEIKRDSPDLKILAISGGGVYNDLSSLEMVKLMGVDGTLTKPISAESLIALVNELLI